VTERRPHAPSNDRRTPIQVQPLPGVDVFVATEEDFRAVQVNALRRAGCTMKELREQARTGACMSWAARRASMVLRWAEKRTTAQA
jgi:hypothetical protein